MDIFARSFTLLHIRPYTRSLEGLPQEVLRRIVEHADLDTQDRKAISLTCSTLRSHALPSLFRRITISQLRLDREKFLSICHTPHLVQYVREVEWQEISWHPGFFSLVAFKSGKEKLLSWLWCWYHLNSGSRTPDLSGMLRAGDQGAQLAFQLDESIKNLFWLSTIPDFSSSKYPTTCAEMRDSGFSQEEINTIRTTSGQFGERLIEFDPEIFNSVREDAIASFRPRFEDGLGRLPYLTGALSRPMDPDRVVCSGGYELQAVHFQAHHTSWDEKDGPIPTANDGLFLFLFPAIERLGIRITRLLWQDEYQYYSCFRPIPCPEVFEHLQKLELSFYFPRRIQLDNPDVYETINSLLETATDLTHLVVDSNLVDSFYLPCIRSTRLVSLHLHSTPAVTCDELIPVLQRNAKTLRHIGLDSSALSLGSLNWIREYVPNLQLESCRLMGATQNQDWVPESHVVDYLNRHGSQDQAGGQRENSFEWGELLFKRIAIFTEDDLMGAPCREDSEESEDFDMAEEHDYEFGEGSAADDRRSIENAVDDVEDVEISRYDEAMRPRTRARAQKKRRGRYAPYNSGASEVDEGAEAEGMEVDEDSDTGNREGGPRSELSDAEDTEMLDDDDAGEREGPTADREHETSLKEESEIDEEDGGAGDEMEEAEDSDDEEMDVVDDSESIMSSNCVETNERVVGRKIVYSEFVDEDNEDWESNKSEYSPSISSEGSPMGEVMGI
ncbi:unnamed protein product [Clonostachys solani]|uniref:F-box domain-containing protein n=1 Tax=Clonostachys solani TaxID=160281 RepID=A0A9N9YUQ6_9HYPO|nr:unnamed protein product [Clonostachys solani]